MCAKKFYCARIYVTHRCNSNCTFCDTHDKFYRTIGDMTLDTAKILLRQLKAASCVYVDLTGGEPTLNENLPAIIDFAKEFELKTEVTTNATAGLTETLRLCALKARKLNISLDTLNPKRYAKLRGVDKLRVVLQTVRQIVKIRAEAGLIVPKLMTVATKENVDDLPEIIDFATKNGLEVYINPVFSYGAMKFSVAEISARLTAYVFKPHVIVPIHFLEFLRDLQQNGRPPCRCGAAEQILTFAANGQLLMPCYHAREKILVSQPSELTEFLAGDDFAEYSRLRGKLLSCATCAVTPNFGISFSFKADKFFLLQSFSDRLEHFKRDFLNKLPHYEQPPLRTLDEFLSIVRLLPPAEESATDCWELEHMPHHFFDVVCSTAFNRLSPKIDAEADLLSAAPEFMVKWWKISVMRQMYLPADIAADIAWVNDYLAKLERHLNLNPRSLRKKVSAQSLLD